MRRLFLATVSVALTLSALSCSQDPGGKTERSDAEGAGPDAGDVRPDSDSSDATSPPPDDTDTVPDDTSSDEDTTDLEDTGLADSGGDADAGVACQTDTDSDGIADCDEKQLCTDLDDGDTDNDSLSDLEELQKYQSDPCKSDSDNDGLPDGKEQRFGLDPNAASTYNDGTLDGKRWFVNACQNIGPEAVNFQESKQANWLMALPPSFGNYKELTITNFKAPRGAAVYDDPVTEVAGFTLSKMAGSNQSSPLDPLKNSIPSSVRSTVQSIDFNLLGPEFTTHDGKKAAVLEYEVTSSRAVSARRLRDQLLFALGPFKRSDVSGLPNSSGSKHTKFRLEISVILRRHQNGDKTNLVSIALAPLSKFQTADKVKFRIDDLTNTTNIADAVDFHRKECAVQPPGKETPKTEFYWVLDASGSMSREHSLVKSFADKFVKRVKNTRLDYRIGVTNMNPGNSGRLGVPPGWHKSASVFKRQVDCRVAKCRNCAPSGWGCGSPEQGLDSAYKGLQYMLGRNAQQPTPAEKIRSGASVITIWMTDEKAQGSNHPAAKQFYANNSNMAGFALTTQTSKGSCRPGAPAPSGIYKSAALGSGGGSADLCSGNLKKTLTAIIRKAAELSTNFTLGKDPISSSLRVYVDNQWVPRSRENGFDYSPRRNVLTFYGKHRPDYNRNNPNEGPDWVAVVFETFQSRCKETGMANTCRPPSP